MKAIWVPNPSWDFEDEQVITNDRLFKVTSIQDIADVIVVHLGEGA
jgi:hypothetical protein